jgi:hypothetical protein
MPVTRYAFLILALCSSLGNASADEKSFAPSEYQVKAAFIYKFATYVHWPPGRAADEYRPFVIGILGDDPFGSQFEEIVRGQRVQKRPIHLIRFREIEDLTRCDILFISASERMKLRKILEKLGDAPVLTVADMDDFAERGGMINLTNEGNRIRFAINVAAIERARLKAASQLLRLATIVREPEAR